MFMQILVLYTNVVMAEHLIVNWKLWLIDMYKKYQFRDGRDKKLWLSLPPSY